MIVLYKGSRGKGKTLSMTRDAYKYYLQGYRVFSNYSLTFSEHITNNEVLALNRDSNLYNCVLVLDEIQLLFDSRNFRDSSSISFSNFIQQVRKRNIIILATTQYVNTIDKRLRQHLDIFAYPEFIKDLNYCKVTYLDISFLEDIDLNILLYGSIDETLIKKVTIIYPATPIYPLYNTYEMLR